MIEALERAQAIEFITRQAEGLDTVIGERGRSLSGRRAPAPVDRPRAVEEPADPDPRRGDERARRRDRAQAADGARRGDEGPHDLRHRPPPRHHPQRQPHPRLRSGARDRERHLRRARGAGAAASRSWPRRSSWQPKSRRSASGSRRTHDASPSIRSSRVFAARSNGVTLHMIEAGPEDGPLVILLHGFPEFWWGWRYQIGAAGRGRLPRDRAGPARLQSQRQAAGPARLRSRHPGEGRRSGWPMPSGGRPFPWSATTGAAWWPGGRPRAIRSASRSSPSSTRRIRPLPEPTCAAHPSQMLRSLYVGFFQIPCLPEAMLSANGYRSLKDALLRTSRPGTFSERGYRSLREGLVAARRAHGDAELVSRPAVQARHERSRPSVRRRS